MLESSDWKTCKEDNYPGLEEMGRTLLACPLCDEVFYYQGRDCPYGWNVLVGMEAKFVVLPEPNF